MTPGQLVKAVSIALGVPEETVVQHDRNLVVAGLRSKGGRGRSAPEVTALDAARLFIAILGSVRTKDSVETVEQFERAIFHGKYALLGGVETRVGKDPRAQKFDSAIACLPVTHSVVEALAALIQEASRPIEDLQSFLDRFVQLSVSCTSPSGEARIGEVTFARYSPAHPSPNGPQEISNERRIFFQPSKRDERSYCASGVHQERRAYGSAIMLLGAAFRDNGLRFANAREAYAAGFRAQDERRKQSAAASRTQGR